MRKLSIQASRQESTEGLSCFYSPLLFLEKFLEDFVMEQNFPVDIKEAKTGKYILNNKACAQLDGLTFKERVGLTIQDLAELNHLPEQFVKKIVDLDHKIATGAQAFFEYGHVYYSRQRQIAFHKTIKKPILNHHNKIIAIFSYSQDITPYMSPIQLYKTYKDLYCKRLKQKVSLAIEAFLRHYQIDTVFYSDAKHNLPTEKELLTLLAMRKSEHAKVIAGDLGISYRTVEEYKQRLRNKLKVISLNELVMRLRTYYEDKYGIPEFGTKS